MDMGLVKGAEIEVERVAPLGDPLEVKIKGYHLSLSKEEAARIFVETE
jgi:Fe2+ transport system protein FeoA